MKKIFKAYDIRGVFPDEINEEESYKIGRAIVSYLGCSTVVVGRDARESSDTLFSALSRGITDQGADVIDIGMSTTPMLYFSAGNYGFDAGVMITASHNPAKYNGFKICRAGAVPVGQDSGLTDIEGLVLKNKFEEPEKKGSIIKKEIMDDYVSHVLSFIDVSKIKPLKIAMDAGNGMVGLVAPSVFSKTAIESIPLYFEPDCSFPNHPANPIEEENRRDLVKKVIESEADMGFIWDGDGDRFLVVDEKGDVVPGDILAALLAELVLKEQSKSEKEVIYYTLICSNIVKETVEKNRGLAKKCRVGHAFIKNYMRTDNALFAGENSGHFYFRDNFFAESGIIAALLVSELVSEKGVKLSELVSPLKKYFKIEETNFVVDNKEEVMERIKSSFSEGEISTLDGVSVDFKDSWFNVRSSNTEPLLRLNLEAETEEGMLKLKQRVESVITG